MFGDSNIVCNTIKFVANFRTNVRPTCPVDSSHITFIDGTQIISVSPSRKIEYLDKNTSSFFFGEEVQMLSVSMAQK